jgi:hypothetical protein
MSLPSAKNRNFSRMPEAGQHVEIEVGGDDGAVNSCGREGGEAGRGVERSARNRLNAVLAVPDGPSTGLVLLRVLGFAAIPIVLNRLNAFGRRVAGGDG